MAMLRVAPAPTLTVRSLFLTLVATREPPLPKSLDPVSVSVRPLYFVNYSSVSFVTRVNASTRCRRISSLAPFASPRIIVSRILSCSCQTLIDMPGYTQVCDPKTMWRVPFGERGTPVYTHLERTSQPMIRLVSGDLTLWQDGPTACGRTYRLGSRVIFWTSVRPIRVTATFEDLGVAAYNGAGKLLESGDYLLQAGRIVSVEARHAAAIRDLLQPGSVAFAGPDVVDKNGLDGAMEPAKVLAAADPFIKTEVTANSL